MKHVLLSVVCLVFVAVYSIFTFSYINDFKKDMDSCISNSSTFSESECKKINSIYENKEKVLRIIVNNELTCKLEEIIISLNNAVNYSNLEETDKQIELLRSIIDDISYQNKCII